MKKIMILSLLVLTGCCYNTLVTTKGKAKDVIDQTSQPQVETNIPIELPPPISG